MLTELYILTKIGKHERQRKKGVRLVENKNKGKKISKNWSERRGKKRERDKTNGKRQA